MPPFLRVDARRAGPAALGILVPPGPHCPVILRPRALPWDLLPLRPGMEQLQPAVFCSFDRDGAAQAARRLFHALEQAAGRTPNPVEVVGAPPGERYGVCARLDGALWLACRRAEGAAYQPWLDPSLAVAEELACRLTALLWPAADAGQEVYFNTQAFAR
jgi:hypothetical protein